MTAVFNKTLLSFLQSHFLSLLICSISLSGSDKEHWARSWPVKGAQSWLVLLFTFSSKDKAALEIGDFFIFSTSFTRLLSELHKYKNDLGWMWFHSSGNQSLSYLKTWAKTEWNTEQVQSGVLPTFSIHWLLCARGHTIVCHLWDGFKKLCVHLYLQVFWKRFVPGWWFWCKAWMQHVHQRNILLLFHAGLESSQPSPKV